MGQYFFDELVGDDSILHVERLMRISSTIEKKMTKQTQDSSPDAYYCASLDVKKNHCKPKIRPPLYQSALDIIDSMSVPKANTQRRYSERQDGVWSILKALEKGSAIF